MLNPEHKHLIADINGFSRDSATTRQAAIKYARDLAYTTGLDMSVCYSDRTPFGTRHHVINVRCKDARKLARRHYTLNGQAVLSGETYSC